MRLDSRRGDGSGARDRLAFGLIVASLLACAVTLPAGCGDAPAEHPSGAAEAFAVAHPSGRLPAILSLVGLSRGQVGRRISDIAGRQAEILLPTRLPDGFGLAAPYVAVGDGSARPNPEVWGRRYRVSYTDGHGLLVMTYGAASRDVAGVTWSGRRLRVDGRRARAGREDGAVVVATIDDRPLIVVTGRQVALESVLACAESIRLWR